MNNGKCIICHNVKFSNLFQKNNYQVVKCIFCNFMFLNPLPNKSQLIKYYKNFDYKTGFINEYLIRQDSIRTLQNIKKLGYENGSLLDIGCGAGFFLDEARKFGWNVRGIDTSEISADYGQKKLKLEITIADFLNYEFRESKFKVITLLQVIEHLSDSKLMLRKIYKLLEPNGLLCVATPNIKSYLAQVMHKDFTYMIPPEHVVFYSIDTLRKLLSNIGYKIIKIDSWGYPSDLASIIKYLLKKGTSNKKKLIEDNLVKSLDNTSDFKKMKYFIFDNIFCKLFYRLLNLNYGGSILEIYAKR